MHIRMFILARIPTAASRGSACNSTAFVTCPSSIMKLPGYFYTVSPSCSGSGAVNWS